MKTRTLILILATTLLATACVPKTPLGRNTVPFVREILSDKSSPVYEMLSEYSRPNSLGDIYFIGPEESCSKIVGAMLTQDNLDNVDGVEGDDGLKDFAGETLACIVDTLSYTYPQLVSERKEYVVRERAVRMALAAVDTTCHLSPYDLEGMGKKLPAKMIVLADPTLAQYGKFDIDTLFSTAGCGIPVVTPLDVMFDEVFDQAGNQPVRVGLICEPRFAESYSFQARFTKAMRRHGNEGSKCIVLPTRDDEGGVMKSFLDDFMAGHYAFQLDFIVIDDITLDVNELKSELASLISVMNEESMTYSRCIASEFSVLDPASSVSRKCYQILRKDNLFTHNIAQPQVSLYYPALNPNEENDSIILIPGTYVQN